MKEYFKATLALSGFIICMLFTGGASAGASGGELTGTWILTIDTPRGVRHPSLVINKDGDSYSGVYNSLRGPIDIEAISRDGDSFAFPLVITVPIGDIEVNYRGTINGDAMTGSVQSPRGEVPFTAKRSEP
ncbi:MAG: hypothetical protein O6766_10210 [Gammaproteobacteria bacterium]|nr:hypothetical protein [Gammaproteobacteria bacterium]